jgi:hypothetical protein
MNEKLFHNFPTLSFFVNAKMYRNFLSLAIASEQPERERGLMKREETKCCCWKKRNNSR